MTIYLVRHGEAAAPWHESDDPGLNERGHAQAAEVARLLHERIEPGSQLLSSPLRRARETAGPLAEMLATDVIVNAAFREIPAPVELAQRQEWLRTVYRQPWHKQIDSVRDWYGTLLDALHGLREPTVVFTHFMVLNAVVGTVSGEDRLVCFAPDNVSVTALEWEGERLVLAERGREIDRALR